MPIFGTDVSTEAMARAAKLVGPDAEVEALFVLRVPPKLKLHQALEREEELGRNVLEVARLQARARRLKVRAKLIRSRNPGKTIVKEAIERRSDLIYLSTDHAPSDERLLGPTARHVLANRPCRVIVESRGRDPGSAGPSSAMAEERAS